MNEILDDCEWFADKHRGKNKQSGPHWSTIIRFPELYDEAVRLERRVETLEAYISDFAPDSMKIARLEAEIEESNRLLRSTYQIAVRDGKDTNWEAFRNQVYIALVRQHEQMCPKSVDENLPLPDVPVERPQEEE